MSREDLQFDQMMKQIGVRPLHKRDPIKPLQFQASADDDAAADEEFAAAMAELDAPRNKDAAVVAAKPRRTPVREVRYSAKARLHVEATLDLHGKRQEEALFLLDRFIRQCQEDGMREVAIITGKGHHSHGGVAVIKPLVRTWLLTDGEAAVATLGEAPRTYGGAGVWVVTLRTKKKVKE